MQRWAYASIRMKFSFEHGDWVASYNDGTAVVGIESLLNAYGAQGWELVSLTMEKIFNNEEYRATFKYPQNQ